MAIFARIAAPAPAMPAVSAAAWACLCGGEEVNGLARQRLRALLTKGFEVRFLSHLEYMGTLEKALRRAAIPMALSQGFNPQPQLAPASALPVGHSSQGELVDVWLARAMDPASFTRQWNHALPLDIRVLEVRDVSLDTPSLMSQVNRAAYLVSLHWPGPGDVPRMWEQYRNQPRLPVSRRGKKGWREIDARPLLRRERWRYVNGVDWLLELHLGTGEDGSLRPEELLQSFFQFYQLPGVVKEVQRTGLYMCRGQEIRSPLHAAAPGPG